MEEKEEDFDVIAIVRVNPHTRTTIAERIHRALEACPEHGAIKVSTMSEVIAYRDWCVNVRKKNPGFRQRIEKLAKGGWLLFKNINFAEEFYKENQ